MCDDTSAINLTKNSVLHSRTKHIEIHHHFLCDHVVKWDVIFEHVDSKNQLTDIVTKLLQLNYFSTFEWNWGFLISQMPPKHICCMHFI